MAARQHFLPAVDLEAFHAQRGKAGLSSPIPNITGVFGEKVEVGPEDDPVAIAETMPNCSRPRRSPSTPAAVRRTSIYPYNVEFRKKMEELGINYHYEEWPGVHGWDFWDQSIDKALKYLLPNG